jgi:hypothetical protein
VDEQPPDGSAATLYTVISSIQPKATSGLIIAALLFCGPPVLLLPLAAFLLGVLTWAVWQGTTGAHPGSKRLLRGSLGTAIIGTMMLPLSVAAAPASIGAVLGLWLVWWLSTWRFVRRRATDPAIRRTLDRGFAPLGLSLLLGTMSALPALLGSEAWVAVLLLLSLLGALASMRWPLAAMKALWPLPHITPKKLLGAIEKRLSADYGLAPVPWPSGLRLTGRDAQVDVDLSTAPASVHFRVPLGVLPGLQIRARRPDDVGGTSADPLLSRLLFIEGAGDGALLEGLHGELLGVLHAWPGSSISGGILTVHIPGPPFDAARVGEPPLDDDVSEMVDFLARRLDEVLALAKTLRSRSTAAEAESRRVRSGVPLRGRD